MLTIFRDLDTEKKQKAFLWQCNEALRVFGNSSEVWIHGTCDIYVNDTTNKPEADRQTARQKSDYRKENHSPQVKNSAERVCFRKGDVIPSTIEEIELLMQKQRNDDFVQSRMVLNGDAPSIGTMPKEDEPVKEPKPNKKGNQENGNKIS